MPLVPRDIKPSLDLKIPQARVLKALLPTNPKLDPIDWPLYNRVTLAEYAGFNPTTGTINRVLNGVPEGSSSGAPHKGLLERGLMQVIHIDSDGISQAHYRITPLGVEAIVAYLAFNVIPGTRDKASCTNGRYIVD